MADKPLEVFLRRIRIIKAKKEILRHKSRFSKISRILDVGCGFNCAFLKSIKNEIKECYGIDPKVNDPYVDGIEVIREKFIDKLPFEDNFFDIITLLAVIEHIEEIEILLRELYRVINKKGLLLLTAPTDKSERILSVFAKLGLLNPEEIYDHKRHPSQNFIRNTIERCGFKTLKIKSFQINLNCFYVFENPNS